MTRSRGGPILTDVRIRLTFEEDDPLVCICRVKPILTAFPGVTIEVDPAHVGSQFAAKLQRARVDVSLATEGSDERTD